MRTRGTMEAAVLAELAVSNGGEEIGLSQIHTRRHGGNILRRRHRCCAGVVRAAGRVSPSTIEVYELFPEPQ